MRSFLRPLAAVAVIVCLGAYATIMLRGPQGLSALFEKHREIQALEEQNADLQRDINAKKTRIDRLEHDTSAQQLEVRKRLKMHNPGDVDFVLPQVQNHPSTSAPATSR